MRPNPRHVAGAHSASVPGGWRPVSDETVLAQFKWRQNQSAAVDARAQRLGTRVVGCEEGRVLTAEDVSRGRPLLLRGLLRNW
jgi:hypothetical protein